MTEQSRIDKVQKLLAKAERASTKHEADAFFAKAQDLMTKWAIDEAVLAAAGMQDSSDKIVQEYMPVKRSGYFDPLVTLSSVVAAANGVRILVRPRSWKEFAGVVFIGWKADIERVKMLYASLMIQCARERRREIPDDLRSLGSTAIDRWKISYTKGYAIEIGVRLQEQARRTQEQAVSEDATGSLLPAVIDRKSKVNDYFDGLSTKKGRASRKSYDMNGWESGSVAARRADLGGTGVGSGARKSLA